MHYRIQWKWALLLAIGWDLKHGCIPSRQRSMNKNINSIHLMAEINKRAPTKSGPVGSHQYGEYNHLHLDIQ